VHHRRSMYERLWIGCWFLSVCPGRFFICIQFIKASSGYCQGIVRNIESRPILRWL
jgi:hypothetical protein